MKYGLEPQWGTGKRTPGGTRVGRRGTLHVWTFGEKVKDSQRVVQMLPKLRRKERGATGRMI